MPDLTVAKSLFNGRVPLPRICISCGKPATGECTIRTAYKGPDGNVATDHNSEVGCLLNLLMAGMAVGSTVARENRIKLSVPVCRFHHWIVGPNVVITSDNGDTVELTGVSPEFIARLQNRTE